MKTLIAASAVLAVLAVPALADTRYWDAAESEFIIVPDVTATNANAAAAAADTTRYTRTVTWYDPAESVFVTTKVGEGLPASAVATNDPDRPMKRVWDAAESEFMLVPAN